MSSACKPVCARTLELLHCIDMLHASGYLAKPASELVQEPDSLRVKTEESSNSVCQDCHVAPHVILIAMI